MKSFPYSLAIVTGASSGIGQSIARKLLDQGVFTIITGRNESGLARLTGRSPNHCQSVAGDLNEVSITLEISRLAQSRLTLEPGPIALVNNAGMIKRESFASTSIEDWNLHWQTNLITAVRLTKALLALMTANSAIVNVSSTLGLRPIPNTLAYSATKAAMLSWTQGLALELAPKKIRVNAVNPGIVDTPIHTRGTNGEASKESLSAMNLAHPLGRMGTSDEIASAVLFLLSEESGWTTGSFMNVDGGISLV